MKKYLLKELAKKQIKKQLLKAIAKMVDQSFEAMQKIDKVGTIHS